MDVDVEIGIERPYDRRPQRPGHCAPALFAPEQRGLLGGSKIGPMSEPTVCGGEVRRTSRERPERAINRFSDDHPPLSQCGRAVSRAIIAIPLPPKPPAPLCGLLA